MSDAKVAKLEGINKVLRWNSLFFIVGFIIIFLIRDFIPRGMEYVRLRSTLSTIGWIIIGLPKIFAVLRGGIGNAIFGPLRADYEVQTVDGFGRILSSDGGALSMQMSLIFKLIQLGAIVALGGILTTLHVIFLSFKYAATALITKAKSSVIPNGFMIILINILVFVGTFIIIGLAGGARQAARYAEIGYIVRGDFASTLTETKDGRTISRYQGKDSNVVIPSTIDGLPVVIISSYAFSGSEITSVVIPEGVTDIEGWAFQNSANLTSVTLPQSLQRIGAGAFKNCTSLTDVNIPQGLTIRHGTYSTTLRSDQTGDFIDTIGKYFRNEQVKTQAQDYHTFSGCTALSDVSRQAIRASGYRGDF